MNQPPIVLHALWRARGTYFWSLFRKDIRFRAYYEPLHEALVEKPVDRWQLEFKTGAPRVLRHPSLDAHYASEYPLSTDRGLPHFKPTMSYGNFFLRAEDEDQDLEAYLRWLIDYAALFGQRSFFKITRGGLRAGFIRRVLGGAHIYVNRPPSELHASYRSFGSSSYFTATLTYLLIRYADRPLCGATIECMRAFGAFDDAGLRDRFSGGLTIAYPISNALTDSQSAILTASFWLAYLLEGLAVADVTIDTERLGADEKYRSAIGAVLVPSLGRDAFADYRATPCRDDFTAYAQPLRRILAADKRLGSLAAEAPARALDSLGDASRRLLDAVL
jgi:hypothetical protein